MFTGNPDLRKLPASTGNLTGMQKLALAGCGISDLPPEMQNCRDLELLRISADNFETRPPDWLFTLPRLAWYSDAGNPFCADYPTQKSLLVGVPWSDVTLAERINESPSSEVFVAALTNTGEKVAAKLFKRSLTSDGYPEDDMRACMAAGQHDNLVAIRGALTEHPEGRQGLIMSLIPPRYEKLGLPPDFVTCTRDTFPPHTSFSLPFIANALHGIAAACRHLHGKGIAHGDIYAHNAKVDAAGHVILGDFGAASFYNPLESKDRERLDVRAFGCLVDDLLNHRDPSVRHNDIADLRQLQQACMHEDIASRPTFPEICATFEANIA
jgi:hypothetical protein